MAVTCHREVVAARPLGRGLPRTGSSVLPVDRDRHIALGVRGAPEIFP